MKNLFIIISLMVFVFSCKKSDLPPEPVYTNSSVIAYCLQPATGLDIHKIYTINADGTENKRVITASIGLNHHDWSPNANKLAALGYVNQSTNSIYVFNADGTNFTRFTDTPGVIDSDPAWSPDGTQIAFTRSYPDDLYRVELWIMSADGNNQHSIGIDGYYAEWSPDATKFIYSSEKSGNSEIYTCSANGANEQKLTSTSSNECFPVYSNDGSKIAFAGFPGNSTDITSYEIYVMNADGTGVVRLTNNNCYDSYPRWSPDNTLISFCSDRSATNHWEVYIMNSDGTNVRRVTNTPGGQTAINATWRPI